MLGRVVDDPAGVEGPAGSVPGLGLLDVSTVLSGEKRLAAVSGRDAEGVGFSGFEMHMGRTSGPDAARPLLWVEGRPDGACSADGLVMGTYVHGLFGDDAARAAWLRRMGAAPSGHRHAAAVDAALDGLALHLGAHMDLDRLLSLAA
jgi:adenosylcobyric acid synthase